MGKCQEAVRSDLEGPRAGLTGSSSGHRLVGNAASVHVGRVQSPSGEEELYQDGMVGARESGRNLQGPQNEPPRISSTGDSNVVG